MITREPEYFPPSVNAFGRIGRELMFFCRGVGRGILLLGEALFHMRSIFTKRSRREVVYQMFHGGVKSLGVITIVSMFTGMILALQTGIELSRYNQEVNIGGAVMVSMMREMGPFMTGLILAASVGSAYAAQMGTMIVSEEIAALEVMSINPVRFLVMPRLAALMVMTPLLAFYACMMGVIGGGLVGRTQFSIPWSAYLRNAMDYAYVKDLYVGILKAFIFGIIITTVACYQGFSTTQGAVGVGNSTRRTVVICFLSILISGYIITRFFYI